MKVLHVITGMDTGGAETALCRLLETLQAPGHAHTVVSLLPEGTLSQRARESAEVLHLGMRPGRISAEAVRRLRDIVRNRQPDVVHGWMYHANLIATLATRGCGVPLLWGIRQSLYELANEKRSTRLVIRACALLSRQPARILYNAAVSAKQHSAYGFSDRRAALIPNGYDVDKFSPDPLARARLRAELNIAADELAIGMVARVHPVKDHGNFLRAAARFAKTRPHSVFVMVGDGASTDNPKLLAQIATLGLQSRVRLCGRRTDMVAVNNALDIACCSSWGEAFPNVIAEAMACGTPCAATDVGDAHEIIGDTGIVVPPHDPDALSEAWDVLANLGERQRAAWGRQARQRIIENYSMISVAQQYAKLYATVAGKG